MERRKPAVTVTAGSAHDGIDAVTHALGSYVSIMANEYSDDQTLPTH